MKTRRTPNLATIALACMVVFVTIAAQACTGIQLIAEDGTVVYARTMEFGNDIQSDVMMIPRGYARVGTTPDGKEGL